MNQPLRLWGGRFSAEPDPALTRLSRSEASDFGLVSRDLAGSRAHIRELDDFLARRGAAFSKAHEIDDAGLASIDPRLTPDTREHLTLEAALDARMAKGGTSPARVAEQIDRLTQRLAAQRDRAEGYRGPQP